MGILQGCKPREEVLKGDLNDAIFAADFGNVIVGRGPEVYKDAPTFFHNTYPTKPLCHVVQDIFSRLAEPGEPGATIRLSTGFGGGKTHTLIALWHLGRNVSDPGLGTDLLPAAGRPKSVTVVAIDAQKAGEVFARHGDNEIRSLWGEIAYQLGGESAWRKLGSADQPETHPDEALLTACFPDGPVLILLDELVEYMAHQTEHARANLLAFINKMLSIVSNRPQTVFVITDPADQRAYAMESNELDRELTTVAIKLDDLLSRKVSDKDPIGDEAARVIATRLFDSIDETARQAASAVYHSLYERVSEEIPGAIPPAAATSDYAKRIVECYPFHPRLLETAQGRLASLQDFQKSRGVLRLFGRIIRDVWENGQDLELITAGDLNWSSDRIQADLLQRLNRQELKAAVVADIDEHARTLDGGPQGIHRRVASALLLDSLPLSSNDGMDTQDLTLAVLRPDEAGPEPSEALDHLIGVCWHTYPIPGRPGFQFRREPNVNRLIEERAGQIDFERARDRVFSEVQGYFSGSVFKLIAWPSSAQQAPETANLALALCDSEDLAEKICKYCDTSDPHAPIPRRFVNAIVAVSPTTAALNAALERARRLLAADDIEREHRHGDAGRLIREQLSRIKPDMQKRFRIETYRAFNVVATANGRIGKIEEVFQVPDDEILSRPQGQKGLKQFLDEKKLIYALGESLDPTYFLRILTGATPLVDHPGVFTAKAVHERFLSAPGLRLIPDGGVVRETIKRSVNERKIIVRTPEGVTYDAEGSVRGLIGQRRRTADKLTTLALEDTTWIALADAADAQQWIRVDEPQGPTGGGGGAGEPPPPPPPPPPGQLEARTWEDAIRLAADHALKEVRLTATAPADSTRLGAVAQPLSADSIALTVLVSGQLKDGGLANFQVSGVKLTHPVKPLDVARTLTAACHDGATYQAVVTLSFGVGRLMSGDLLQQAAGMAPDSLQVYVLFV